MRRAAAFVIGAALLGALGSAATARAQAMTTDELIRHCLSKNEDGQTVCDFFFQSLVNAPDHGTCLPADGLHAAIALGMMYFWVDTRPSERAATARAAMGRALAYAYACTPKVKKRIDRLRIAVAGRNICNPHGLEGFVDMGPDDMCTWIQPAEGWLPIRKKKR